MKWFIVLISLAIGATASPSIQLYKDTLTGAEEKIVNGQTCSRREILYQVSILHSTLIIKSHLCGGILISTKYVLTAAHCKQRSGKYTAVLGQYNRDEIHRDVQKIEVREFIIHEKFAGGVSKYDIGLLLLKKAARLSPAVEPINLPTSASDCDSQDSAKLSGWGQTGGLLPTLPYSLRCADLPIISNEECGRNITNLIGNSGPLDDTMICTGTNVGSKPQSACHGDSGGPLAAFKNNTIIGIVSWGITPCGTKYAPSVYTNVCSYTDWIEEKMDAY